MLVTLDLWIPVLPKVPLIRQYVFEQVTSTLENKNLNVERALAKQGIPDWRYLGGNEVIPLIDFIKSMEAGAKATGEETFSMQVAEEHGLDSFGDFGKAIQSGVTVYDAMSIACRLITTQVPTLKWWTARQKAGYLLCREQSVKSSDLEQALTYLERYTMLLLLNIIRTGAGPKWSPPRAYLSAQKNDTFGDWAEFENASIEFEASCSAIFVPYSILVKPLHDQPIPIAQKEAFVRKQMLRDELGEDFVNDMRMLTRSLILNNSADLNTLSEVTRLNRRAIQRELAKHGQSFSKVLQKSRFQLSLQFLNQMDLDIREISQLLGYEHPQHFIRAFRRNSGVTPGQYRQIRNKEDP